MTFENDDSRDATSISEEDAHRLLARAAELDARQGASVPIAQLREVAREAGIAPEAFLQALTELEAGALGPKTVGQAVSAWLARYRRPAVLAAWLVSSFITPGDVVFTTAGLALAFYGAYEGCVLLLQWLGRRPRRPAPPLLTPAKRTSSGQGSTPSEPTALSRRLLLLREA